MKQKLLSMLTLLMLCTSAVWAQVETGKLFTSSNARGVWYYEDVLKGNIKEIDPTDSKQLFALIEYNDAIYLWSEGGQNFLNNVGKAVHISMASPVEYTTHDGTYFFHFTDAAGKYINHNGTNIVIDGWSTADDGNKQTISYVDGIDMDVINSKIYGLTSAREAAIAMVNSYYLASESLISTAVGAIEKATTADQINSAAEAAFADYQTEVSGKVWHILNGFSGYYDQQGVHKSLVYNLNASGKMNWATLDTENPNSYLKIEVIEGGKINISTMEGIYMQGVAGAMGAKASASAITLVKYEDGTFNLNCHNGTVHTEGHNNGAGDHGNLVKWAGGAGTASSWTFQETTLEAYNAAKNKLATITYNYKWNGETIQTETIQTVIGEALPAVSVPYGVNAQTPEGNVTKDAEYDIACTLSSEAPFLYSADFDNATWYTLTIRGNKYPAYNTETGHVANGTTAPEELAKKDLFAFVGTPWNLKIINAKMGDGNALGCVYGDGKKFESVALADAMSFQLENNDNHLVFVCMNGNEKQVGHVNDVNSELGIWTYGASATDGGSTFTFEEVDADLAQQILNMVDKNWDGLYAAINNDYAKDNRIGDELNQYNSQAYKNAIAAAQAMYEAKTASAEEIEEAITAVNDAIAKLEINQPDDQTFLRIRSVKAGMGRLIAEASEEHDGSLALVGNYEMPASSIFYYADGNLLSYTTGQYLVKNDSDAGFLGLGETGEWGASIKFETSKAKLGTYAVNFDGRYLYAGDNATSTDAGYSADNNGYSFWLEPVTTLPVAMHEVDGHSYATFYAPVNMTVPEGAKAYTVSISGEWAVMTAVSVIPANTGVVLYSEDAAETVNLTVGGEAASATSILTGDICTTEAEAGNLTLQNNSEKGIGFYCYTGTERQGFKAYMKAGADVKGFALNFNEETLIRGIQQAEKANAPVFDLSGRRILKAQKGIFIQNGQKIVK